MAQKAASVLNHTLIYIHSTQTTVYWCNGALVLTVTALFTFKSCTSSKWNGASRGYEKLLKNPTLGKKPLRNVHSSPGKVPWLQCTLPLEWGLTTRKHHPCDAWAREYKIQWQVNSRPYDTHSSAYALQITSFVNMHGFIIQNTIFQKLQKLPRSYTNWWISVEISLHMQ